ncbi:ester cyclase [Streptomyces sp. SudanB66_2053]|uniref:ester cyclase n=1 Tax=Streptomyces sp. SudanB66_2053 TaxID=3035277 RepID=UPI003F568A02
MNDAIAERNIATAKRLLEDAMPNLNWDLMRSLVTPDAPILRAGFADIYAATGTDIPQSGNFIQWLETGWKKLSQGLNDVTSKTTDVVANGNTVLLSFHMTALHSATFAGAPATGKRVAWDEIGVLHFNDEGKITDMWFMCSEVGLVRQLGYELKLA